MGGLSRRAYLIKQITKENKPVLILDAGALLFEKPVIHPSQVAAKKAKAEGIVRIMDKMNYQAIGIASHDLTAGAQFLKHIEESFTIPFVSVNLASKKDGSLLFKPYLVEQTGDIAIAVIGLTGIEPASLNTVSSDRDYTVLAWQDALHKALNDVQPKVDMVILLSSFPEQKNREIASQFPGINLILQSGYASANRSPNLQGDSLITQIGARGKYLGKMVINWTPAKKWEQNFTLQTKNLQDRLDRINWQIGRLEKRYQNKKSIENNQYKKLQQAKIEIISQIEQVQNEKQQVKEQLSSYSSVFTGLKISLPEDREVLTIVNNTKQIMNDLNRTAMQKLKGRNVQPLPSSNMAGWKSCQECHPSQTAFWKQTKHAAAWQTLVKANQHFSQDCLICHVTLPTYDKETVMKKNLIAGLTGEFHNVTCESCHGPGKTHGEQPEQFKPSAPGEKTCLNCHTPDHDTDFDYERKFKLIRCPPSKKTGMTK